MAKKPSQQQVDADNGVGPRDLGPEADALSGRIAALVALARQPQSQDRERLFNELTDLFCSAGVPDDPAVREQLLDLLSALMPHVTVDSRQKAANRVLAMANPPTDFAMRLARDDVQVSGDLIRLVPFSDNQLIDLIFHCGRDHHMMIARRADLTLDIWLALARVTTRPSPTARTGARGALFADDLGRGGRRAPDDAKGAVPHEDTASEEPEPTQGEATGNKPISADTAVTAGDPTASPRLPSDGEAGGDAGDFGDDELVFGSQDAPAEIIALAERLSTYARFDDPESEPFSDPDVPDPLTEEPHTGDATEAFSQGRSLGLGDDPGFGQGDEKEPPIPEIRPAADDFAVDADRLRDPGDETSDEAVDTARAQAQATSHGTDQETVRLRTDRSGHVTKHQGPVAELGMESIVLGGRPFWPLVVQKTSADSLDRIDDLVRHHRPIRDEGVRFVVSENKLSDAWILRGKALFDRLSGRFEGYDLHLRRPEDKAKKRAHILSDERLLDRLLDLLNDLDPDRVVDLEAASYRRLNEALACANILRQRRLGEEGLERAIAALAPALARRGRSLFG